MLFLVRILTPVWDIRLAHLHIVCNKVNQFEDKYKNGFNQIGKVVRNSETQSPKHKKNKNNEMYNTILPTVICREMATLDRIAKNGAIEMAL